jgi:hypothetical protein
MSERQVNQALLDGSMFDLPQGTLGWVRGGDIAHAVLSINEETRDPNPLHITVSLLNALGDENKPLTLSFSLQGMAERLLDNVVVGRPRSIDPEDIPMFAEVRDALRALADHYDAWINHSLANHSKET